MMRLSVRRALPFTTGEPMTEAPIHKTPLHALHVELGARMAPFAGYDMPIKYPAGVLAEHLHTRKAAGLFDVSHMGQALIEGADHAAVAGFLESLCPADLLDLAPGASATPNCSTKAAESSTTSWSPARRARTAR